MGKITQIKISGFRRLRDITLKMRDLMVMIGANGVGKTSILDALSLISASAAGSMSRRLSEMSGIGEVLTRDYSGNLILRVEMEVPRYEPLEYEIQLEPKGQTYGISYEALSQNHGQKEPFKHIDSHYDKIHYFNTDTGKIVKPSWEHNAMESSLSQVPKMFKEPEELRKVLSSASQFHVLDVGQRAPVKLPQQMAPTDTPGENGENLVPFLYNLREGPHNDRYEAIEDTLKATFPGFEELNFPPVAAGMLSMTWKEKSFKKSIYIHQLSEGTLRFLWLISLLQSPTLPTITMIDEPEVSLHPELLSVLADLMREASGRTQLIVATHSDRLVRFLKPEEVLVLDMDDNGYSSVRWGDELNLEKWLSEYTLDEVWRLGRMGGRS